MEIRALDHDDRDAAVALWHATGLTRRWNPPDDDFRRAIDGPTSTVLGGTAGGELVATAMVGHDGHRGWIYYLAVQPARQGTGLGAQMTAAAEVWLAEHGAVKVQLMVRRTNDEVAGFYEHLGYRDAEVTVLARWLDREG